MEYLAGRQARVISVYKFMQNYNDLSADYVMITFDDGNLSDFEIAFPILRDFDFTAHFFVATDFVSKKNHMDWWQIKELQKNGFIIGSHAASHKDLSRLGDKDIVYELSHSKSAIEDKLGREVDIVSMPHGGWNKRISNIAVKCGYKAIFISMPTDKLIDSSPYILGRFDLSGNADFDRFRNIISKKYYTCKLELMLYSIKRLIKKALPGKILLKLQENKNCC